MADRAYARRKHARLDPPRIGVLRALRACATRLIGKQNPRTNNHFHKYAQHLTSKTPLIYSLDKQLNLGRIDAEPDAVSALILRSRIGMRRTSQSQLDGFARPSVPLPTPLRVWRELASIVKLQAPQACVGENSAAQSSSW